MADHYAVLGVAAAVTLSEIRRAYRQLALVHHPDRAGPAGTARFQRIAEAYRVLSDPIERSRYDARRAEPTGSGGGRPVTHRTGSAAADELRAGEPIIQRLSGPLDVLVARGAAAIRAGGTVELFVTVEEASRGGIAALAMPLRLPCPTCGGVATPNEVWCLRCEFAGSVVEDVGLRIPIPRRVADGTTFSLADPLGIMPASLRVRIRVVPDAR